MVRAWYMDNSDVDQRLEHHKQPPECISTENLFKITGVEYFQVKSIFYFIKISLLQLKFY